jgi:ribosome-associated protein
MMVISREALLKEVSFKTSRSGGKGGQNVNKVSSKVELNLNIEESGLFTDDQKKMLTEKLSKRINSEGILQVITEEERSQYLNKERSLEKLIVLISRALHQPKLRKSTKPKKSAVEKRLKNKQQNALKKVNRRGLEF